MLSYVLRKIVMPVLMTINRVVYFGKRYHCPVCDSSVRSFIPLPKNFRVPIEIHGVNYAEKDFETLNIDHYMCPVCRSSDRARLISLFLNKNPVNDSEMCNMIHFAPEFSLFRSIAKRTRYLQVTADLMMYGVDYSVDITKMDVFDDCNFDCFICSHVLEHVPDDTAALEELYRILKPGGWGILLSPVLFGLENTHADLSELSGAERLRNFGQEDHLRIYSKSDFLTKILGAGFEVQQLTRDNFSAEIFEVNGISDDSVLYVLRRST